MPTYEYRCKACSQELEVVQSFSDDALTTCEACGGQLRKMFNNVGIAFKGSGFYKNDSRGKATSTAASTDKGGGDSGSGDKARGDKGSGDKGSGDSGSSATKDTGTSPKKDAAASSTSSSTKSDAATSSSKSA